MASPTSPTHGKLGAIYRLRPNGFIGNGLNDVTWGTGFSDTDSAYFTVTIDTAATPDLFTWTKNGAGGASGVSCATSPVSLSDSQTILWAANTGHTVGDKWLIGNLYQEATTESTIYAQIIDANKQLLNPNVALTWTDSGSKSVINISYTEGKATFSGNVGTVHVTGNNGYIPAKVEGGLEKIAYLIDWSMDFTIDMADISRTGQQWKEFIPGFASGTGSANGYLVLTDTFFDAFEDNVDGTQEYFLLQLFSYDPDQDQTGDRFNMWVTFNSFNVVTTLNELVKETLNFQLYGIPSFTANA